MAFRPITHTMAHFILALCFQSGFTAASSAVGPSHSGILSTRSDIPAQPTVLAGAIYLGTELT